MIAKTQQEAMGVSEAASAILPPQGVPQGMLCKRCGFIYGEEGWPPKAWRERNSKKSCRTCTAKTSKEYFAKKKREKEEGAVGMEKPTKQPATLQDLLAANKPDGEPVSIPLALLTKLVESNERIIESNERIMVALVEKL